MWTHMRWGFICRRFVSIITLSMPPFTNGSTSSLTAMDETALHVRITMFVSDLIAHCHGNSQVLKVITVPHLVDIGRRFFELL